MKHRRINLVGVVTFMFLAAGTFLDQNSTILAAITLEDKPKHSNTSLAENDELSFIEAAALYDLFKSDELPFIFDVRAITSYNDNHIENAISLPYGSFTENDLDAIDKLTLNSPIVAYCGCPNHLSGLVARLIGKTID